MDTFMNWNGGEKMNSSLNIYEQILLEEDNSLNFMTLDAKLSKIANEKPSLLLRVIKLLIKLDYHLICIGTGFSMGYLITQDLSKTINFLALCGIAIGLANLRHNAPDMLIHLLKKWVAKIIESGKVLSEADKKELEEIASYLKDLKMKWGPAPAKQQYIMSIEFILSTMAGVGIGGYDVIANLV